MVTPSVTAPGDINVS